VLKVDHPTRHSAHDYPAGQEVRYHTSIALVPSSIAAITNNMHTDRGWKEVSPYLVFCIAVFSTGDLMFGLDASLFGSLQALPSWLNQFGELNEATGKMWLPTARKSIMNSSRSP